MDGCFAKIQEPTQIPSRIEDITCSPKLEAAFMKYIKIMVSTFILITTNMSAQRVRVNLQIPMNHEEDLGWKKSRKTSMSLFYQMVTTSARLAGIGWPLTKTQDLTIEDGEYQKFRLTLNGLRLLRQLVMRLCIPIIINGWVLLPIAQAQILTTIEENSELSEILTILSNLLCQLDKPCMLKIAKRWGLHILAIIIMNQIEEDFV